MRSMRLCRIGLMGLGLSGGWAFAARADIPIRAVRLASGLIRPVYVTQAPGDATHLYIVEQRDANVTGHIRVFDMTTNTVSPTPFLSIDRLTNGNEQGLLGLAFHPSYASNGSLYVNYTDGTGTTQIRRYQRSASNPLVADTPTNVMSISQPQTNHNGGWMGFGPKDGYLYIASGDGGNGNDTGTGHTATIGNAQDLTNLLGKVLRVDVDGDDFGSDTARNYAIPKGGTDKPVKNPFYDNPSYPTAKPEIWHYGLRNPWRNSFDRKTGDMYIGDVGQDNYEEVDFQAGSSSGGTNYGWRFREGFHATPTVTTPPPPGFTYTDPILEYGRSLGVAVTGGYVYRGTENPAFEGTYIFGDYGSAKIWTTKYSGTGVATTRLIQNPQGSPAVNIPVYVDGVISSTTTIRSVSSFGEDAAGRLYITDLAGGEVFRLLVPLPGDANWDRLVDHSDFVALWNNFAPGVTGKTWTQGDFNDDGRVDFTDWQILERNLGRTMALPSEVPLFGEGAAVPEPAAWGLCTILFLLNLQRRGARDTM